jgi:hypothetical protein
MKIKDLFEDNSGIQDHVDAWIEANIDSAEFFKWIDDAPTLTQSITVYRVEHGNRGVKALKELKIGDVWTLGRSTSTSQKGILKGVLKPGNIPPEKACILEITLPSGKSFGRKIAHSDKSHPENVQDEFILKAGVQVRITEKFDPEDDGNEIDRYTFFRAIAI